MLYFVLLLNKRFNFIIKMYQTTASCNVKQYTSKEPKKHRTQCHKQYIKYTELYTPISAEQMWRNGGTHRGHSFQISVSIVSDICEHRFRYL